MISIKTSRELKQAGLIWDPRYYDLMFDIYGNKSIIYWEQHWESLDLLKNNNVWRPRLDQALNQIKLQGYEWELLQNTCTIKKEGIHREFNDNDYEEAVGKALLWILNNK